MEEYVNLNILVGSRQKKKIRPSRFLFPGRGAWLKLGGQLLSALTIAESYSRVAPVFLGYL
jgi:hypothetical protein